jgi:hypothetical protein
MAYLDDMKCTPPCLLMPALATGKQGGIVGTGIFNGQDQYSLLAQ